MLAEAKNEALSAVHSIDSGSFTVQDALAASDRPAFSSQQRRRKISPTTPKNVSITCPRKS